MYSYLIHVGRHSTTLMRTSLKKKKEGSRAEVGKVFDCLVTETILTRSRRVEIRKAVHCLYSIDTSCNSFLLLKENAIFLRAIIVCEPGQ